MTVLLALGLSAGMSKELVKQKFEAKEQKRGFLTMLSGTLATRKLGNALTLFRMGEGGKKHPYQFFSCNFYKRRN